MGQKGIGTFSFFRIASDTKMMDLLITEHSISDNYRLFNFRTFNNTM